MSSSSLNSLPQRIVLGVTGGIAAYKSAEIARLLFKAGIAVDVVMTPEACRFIQPLTFHALTGRPVSIDPWDEERLMQHIALTRGAQAVLVAPATANFIAKLTIGAADDLLSAVCLASDCPIFLAPAMNPKMWSRPSTQRNLAQLRADGISILGPDRGLLACGEEGEGRMLDPNLIVTLLFDALNGPQNGDEPGHLAGKKVLITAGPTFEAIDPVRGLTNRSSGKMGFALAEAALSAGAQVTLVAGPVALPTPAGVTRIDVVSAAEMAAAVFGQAEANDIFIGVAAVADYVPEHSADHKLKKEEFPALSLTLKPTVDILDEVGRRAPRLFRVGFAAETRNMAEFAEQKRQKKKLPMLVLNRATEAIGADENEVTVFDDAGMHPIPKMGKRQLAVRLIEEIAKRYRETGDR